MGDATPAVTARSALEVKDFQATGFDPFGQLRARPLSSDQECCATARAFANRIAELQVCNDSLSESLCQERKARAEAEETGRTKDQFLATVSHELRTPLTAILGWLEILRHQDVDPQMVHGLEVIERSAHAQRQLIEDLLDVARIKTGKLELERSPVRLSSIVDEAIDTLRPSAEAKDINLRSQSSDDSDFVLGDRSRLLQVIWNLLSNAIKFTPRGGRVLVEVEKVGSQIEIKISDTGAGISADFLPYIFEPFRQLPGASRRQGLGLGLAVVRNLIELHGGEVHAESFGEGYGSCFTVSLPVMQSVTAARAGNAI